MKDTSRKSGFTLIELSIVLVIVGLLVGGILIGQSLIESTKINRLISDLNQYDVATTQFYTKFKQTPGDSTYFSPGGDNNRMIDSSTCSSFVFPGEGLLFFGHLSQANMISKTYTATCLSGGLDPEMKSGKITPIYKSKVWGNQGIFHNTISSENKGLGFRLNLDPNYILAIKSKVELSPIPINNNDNYPTSTQKNGFADFLEWFGGSTGNTGLCWYSDEYYANDCGEGSDPCSTATQTTEITNCADSRATFGQVIYYLNTSSMS